MLLDKSRTGNGDSVILRAPSKAVYKNDIAMAERNPSRVHGLAMTALLAALRRYLWRGGNTDSRGVSRSPLGAIRSLSLAIMALGLLLNVALVQFLFALDGIISGRLRAVIGFGQAAVVLIGITMFAKHRVVDATIRSMVRSCPRAIAVSAGIAGMLGAVLAVELSFHAFNTLSARYRVPVVVSYSAPLWQPGVTCASRKTIGERTIYDATYHRDAAGARITPASPRGSSGRDVVFFGGSFTFGQGVNDDETLPNQLAREVPGWRVTNFGFPGQGPAHMLERIQKPSALQPFTGGKLVVLDVFIPDHARRTIGSMRIATTWGKHFPLFALTADNRIEHRGTMITGRPFLQPVYEYIAREPILKCFNVDLPLRIRDRDLELVARIDAEAQSRILATHPEADFRVVLFPDRPDVEFPASCLIPFLEAAGVRYLDYSHRLQGQEGLWIPGDGHPTPKTYAAVAQWIAEDLELREVGPGDAIDRSFTD